VAADHARIVQVGIPSAPSTAFPVREVWRKALTITGVRGRPSRLVAPALELIASGRHPLELLCTHAFAIEDAGEALRLVRDGRDGVVRAVIEPAATTTTRND
jgi:threonine dehydrogenase-like Zn-dependent dehydrogenase